MKPRRKVALAGRAARFAPATRQPLPWVSLDTTIVTLWWVIVTVGFYFYLTGVAAYTSVFGSLASVIVVMACLSISTTAFLFGAQLDAIIRAQAPVRSPASKSTSRNIPRSPLPSLALLFLGVAKDL